MSVLLLLQPIRQVASPLEEIRITHTQGLLGHNISEFCCVVLEKIFQDSHETCNVQTVQLNLLCSNCFWLLFRR